MVKCSESSRMVFRTKARLNAPDNHGQGLTREPYSAAFHSKVPSKQHERASLVIYKTLIIILQHSPLYWGIGI